MRAKASRPQPAVLQRLLERGEETFGQVVDELLARPGVTDGVAKMVKQAAHTGGRMGKNVETLLHLLSLPSRSDYHKLLVKIENVQGSLVNLSMKVDRLLAAQERPKRKKAPLKVEN